MGSDCLPINLCLSIITVICSRLLAANSKNRKSSLEGEKEENQRYSQWFAETLNIILNEKRQELSNIQVILRGTGDKDRYKLSIINKDILNILKGKDVEKALKNLGQYPFTDRYDCGNVHEQAVMGTCWAIRISIFC